MPSDVKAKAKARDLAILTLGGNRKPRGDCATPGCDEPKHLAGLCRRCFVSAPGRRRPTAADEEAATGYYRSIANDPADNRGSGGYLG